MYLPILRKRVSTRSGSRSDSSLSRSGVKCIDAKRPIVVLLKYFRVFLSLCCSIASLWRNTFFKRSPESESMISGIDTGQLWQPRAGGSKGWKAPRKRYSAICWHHSSPCGDADALQRCFQSRLRSCNLEVTHIESYRLRKAKAIDEEKILCDLQQLSSGILSLLSFFIFNLYWILVLGKRSSYKDVQRLHLRGEREDEEEDGPNFGDETKGAPKQLTFRAVTVGLLVGSLLCCSNTYFGLQSGW